MRKTAADNRTDALMLTTEQLMQKLNCGYKTAVEIGAEAGARISIGRRVWYSVRKIEQYLDEKAIDLWLTKGGLQQYNPPNQSNGRGMLEMAAIKKTGLPKGISWREERKCYLGRVTYEGKTHNLYDTNYKRLDAKLQELRLELRKGTYIEESRLTLNEWFDEYMEVYKKRNIKYSTFRNYNQHYDSYIRKGIGKKKIRDITEDDIQKVFNDLCDRGFTTGTIKLVSAVLGGCFRKAKRKNMIAVNPVPLAEIPKGKENRERYVFSREEQQKFMEYAMESYLGDMFYFILMTGLRNGEARALRWCDIDFGKKIISVNHTLIDATGGGYLLDTPKTKCSKRKVPMNRDVKGILLGIRQEADRNGMGADEDYVFCLPDGGEISRHRVDAELGKIEKKMMEAGICAEHITCHCLRHAFATRAIENGMKPQVLKAILGHESLAMTMDLYSHVLGEEKAQEMLLMENLFFNIDTIGMQDYNEDVKGATEYTVSP